MTTRSPLVQPEPDRSFPLVSNGGEVVRSAAFIVVTVAALSLAACRAETRPGNRAGAGDSAAIDVPVASAGDPRWVVTPRGIGPLHAGMTLDEARTAAGGQLPLSGPDAPSCDHLTLAGAPGRVLVMVVDGRVARVEVHDGAIATDRGARIGDGEARIAELYGDRVTVEQHAYTDGHYLVVKPEVLADSAYRLVFETDGQRVQSYRAGLLPSVGWVEGCS